MMHFKSCPSPDVTDDRKSIATYCVFMRDSLVSWSSKIQQVVARSSTKSEFCPFALVATELSWVQSLLLEIGYPSQPTSIAWCDNTSALPLAANPVFHSRSKYVELDVHYIIRDKVVGCSETD
ncbi:Copia protein [Cucumis melo var. makuwa]|uniref:Copia protein n=1 Tax=Cucumis melo var. makuwa TaxID=1194695 RepID=A0A5A7U606_CUCMM|nr:Copia protein [Cucumis melo var. makuwa]TYK15976.1 Copia protein [Cucumis melo var. makuwa]